MYLYKRGNVWWAEWVVRGIRHRKSTGQTNRRRAEEWADAIETARRAKNFDGAVEVLKLIYGAEARTIPLDEAWETYETTAKALGRFSASADTIKHRRSRLAAFRAWLDAEIGTVATVQGVTGVIAARYAASLDDGVRKAKTRRNILADLGTIWRTLAKASNGVEDVWTDLSPADTDGEVLDPFTLAEQRAILQAARELGCQWYEVCMVARYTGLRYGDVAHLTWGEVDLAGGVIRVTPSKTKRHKIVTVLPIAAPLKTVLETIPNNGGCLFPGHAEYYKKHNQADELVFGKVLDRAGVTRERHTFHSWRHTFRTALGEGGVTTSIAMMLCGHTTEEMSRRYDHGEHLAELRDAMSRAGDVA